MAFAFCSAGRFASFSASPRVQHDMLYVRGADLYVCQWVRRVGLLKFSQNQ